jgi:enoyl-CoA hydratase/3-hydroxyacyl-CoA dehydrogenase
MQYIEHFPDRTYKSMMIPLMQEDKRAGSRICNMNFLNLMLISCVICLGSYCFSLSGESTRKGFYLYDDRRKATPDPEVRKYIEKAREISGISIDPKVCVWNSIIIEFNNGGVCFKNGSFCAFS